MNIVLTIISSIIVIILGLMFLHVPYLIADRGMGVFGALRESAKMNKGRKMDIFWGFFLSNLALSLLCWLITLLLDIPLAALNINIDRNVYLMLLWVFIIPLAAFINIYPYLCLTGQLDEMQDAALEAENEADEID